jgi:uncharacterized membrane protein YqaE (UPF0057 family)
MVDLFLDALLAILSPPGAVYVKCGAGSKLVLNAILCLCLWFPGVIHALWVVCSDNIDRS